MFKKSILCTIQDAFCVEREKENAWKNIIMIKKRIFTVNEIAKKNVAEEGE